MSIDLNEGDVVLIPHNRIGVIRYIGFIQGKSSGIHDSYIGIDLKHCRGQKGNSNGSYAGKVYFKTTSNNAVFITEGEIIRKYSPELLLTHISNKDALFSDIPKPQPKPQPKHTQNQNYNNDNNNSNNNKAYTQLKKTRPFDHSKPQQSPSPLPIMNSPQLSTLRKSLSVHYNSNQLSHLMNICVEQDYTTNESIRDDLEEVDNSEIVDYMIGKLDWNSTQSAKFVTQLRNALDSPDPSPAASSSHLPPKHSQKQPPMTGSAGGGGYHVNTQVALPSVYDFIVPTTVMKQKDPRSINDIINCLRKNRIPQNQCRYLKSFFNEEKCTEFGTIAYDKQKLNHLCAKFASKHHNLSVFTEYVKKCIFELSPPMLKPGNFSGKDEKKRYNYFKKQCPGVVRHDKDLLQFFLLTSHTEKGLSSELVDIADRITFFEKTKVNEKTFAKKYFFKHFSQTQADIVTAGLKKYHSRFVPAFNANPMKFIADKISGYQKYAILLSKVVNAMLLKSLGRIAPFMIDLMIIPPGEHNMLDMSDSNDEKKKMYNPFQTMEIGEISDYLKKFSINYGKLNGFNEKEGIGITCNDICNEIVQCIRGMSNNFESKHSNERYCIVVDRRWRLNCKRFVVYERLRRGKEHYNESNEYGSYYNNDDLSDCDNDSEGSEGDGGGGKIVTPGFDSDGDGANKKQKKQSWTSFGWNKKSDNDDGNNGNNDDVTGYNQPFYGGKCDTIYVYRVTGTKKKFDAFTTDFCHETLMYLSKTCILPRKNHITGTHLSAQCSDGYFFNLSAHVYAQNAVSNNSFYKYQMRWYTFMQSAALRFFQSDMRNVWPKYFVDSESDDDALKQSEIDEQFVFDLNECDVDYKRWYYAVKRSD